MNEQPSAASVLFVDDEENILRSIKRLFMDEKFEILTAASGPEGLDVLREQNHIGVIVSDQRMPGMSGAEFLEKSREIVPEAVRIVLTGYADISAAVDAINRGGAWKYLAKPWKDEELIQAVREALERYLLLDENRRLNEVTQRQNEMLAQWNANLETMVQEQTMEIQQKNNKLEKLNEQLRMNFRKTIESFSSLVEMRERGMSSHAKNVATIARDIAISIERPAAEIKDIVVAGLLHDIGKIGVSDDILRKQRENLSETERVEYELHAIRGQVALEAVEGFRDIGRLIRHHHEYVDGTGYPDRLKLDDIPLGSRILSIADAYDVMTNSRNSTADMMVAAVKQIESYSGSRYDRSVSRHLALLIAAKIQKKETYQRTMPTEMVVAPSELIPGMVLARDIKSGTGLLILARDIALNAKMISAVRRYYEIDPPATGVFVRGSEQMRQ
jgi:response regulator RpfG family c-di-GMP phosphodiesterase